MTSRWRWVASAGIMLWACHGSGFQRGTECIAPANPGGGWDLTCRSVATVLAQLDRTARMRIVNLPGAGGGVAFVHTVTQRADDAQVIVAASPATTLRLAQGQYGQFGDSSVRWIAALGAEYGVLAVRARAPWRTLEDLVAAWRRNPERIVLGGGSAVGGQDHMKVLLLAQRAGLNAGRIRYVAFNGGGEALTSLLGDFIQVFSGDASEIEGQLEAGNVRVLAVLAPQRLGGRLAAIPTAKEAGYDVEWVTWRGFYAPAGISDAEYTHWVDLMGRINASAQWAEVRTTSGLEPFFLAGPAFRDFIRTEVQNFRDLSRQIGLVE